MHCYAVCPQGAIGIEGMKTTLSVNHDGVGIPDEKQLMKLFAFRRSTRRFTEKAVDRDVVETLIHAAGLIPSGGNSHAYRFTIMGRGRQRDVLEHELRTIYAFRRRLIKNPLLNKLFALLSNRQTRAFLLDEVYLKRVTYLLEQYDKGEDPIFYGAPLIVIVHTDTVIPTPGEDAILAAYNLVLMAETQGLGSCFVSLAQNAINTSRRCRTILNLKPADKVYAVVVLGYPDVHYHRDVPRAGQTIDWTT
jgi:nitroreductase